MDDKNKEACDILDNITKDYKKKKKKIDKLNRFNNNLIVFSFFVIVLTVCIITYILFISI